MYIAGPSASPINVTSLSISTTAPDGNGIHVTLSGYCVPGNATSCGAAAVDGTLWEIDDASDGLTPPSVTFPTPLQYKPPANTKACLLAQSSLIGQYSTKINAVGFYGN